MTFFKSDPQKYLPQNSVLFSMDSSVGDVFFPAFRSVFGRKNPLSPIFEALFFLYSFLFGFLFEVLYFIIQETMVFIDIPANCIQHKFFVYLFGRTVLKSPEFFVFLYVPKVALCLHGANFISYRHRIFYFLV